MVTLDSVTRDCQRNAKMQLGVGRELGTIGRTGRRGQIGTNQRDAQPPMQ
jgi:hypothetical protein